ncbi:MAG: diphosphate--fructose-6-phosphate 1-phosphotransferase [Clostridia bacterium]|nr:diphosphate--fructose-6-phosphate 1-phosphotransferase [Clostridia bacterium]
MIAQSGGPTCAINASLAGITAGCLASPEIGRILGAVNGIEGVFCEKTVDLGAFFADNTDEKLRRLSLTPSSALGSCRIKLPDPDSERAAESYDRIFCTFEKYSVGVFFYIGGNDSMDTVAKLSRAAGSYPGAPRFIGVPKTIDNDVVLTDHTPGFGSAAKYIAATVQDVVTDCSVYTAKSLTIIEIMGRDSGWLAAAAGIPSLADRGPDLIYLPEVPFDVDRFIEDIELAHRTRPNVVVCVSEGIRNSSGGYVGESSMSGSADVFGNRYLAGAARYLEAVARERIGCKVRAFDLNVPQRCVSFMLSAADISESVGCGRFAVKAALQGDDGVMVSLVRRDNPYRISYSTVPALDVANRVKTVPREFINEAGNGLTRECFDYLLPLIRGEVALEYENGIPKHLDTGWTKAFAPHGSRQ